MEFDIKIGIRRDNTEDNRAYKLERKLDLLYKHVRIYVTSEN